MVNFKKWSRMAAAVLAVCMLAACAPGGNNAKNGKTLELTVWNTQGTDYTAKTLKKNVVEDWLVEKTNVKIKNIYGNDGGQWDPKLTKLIATGNLPDIVVCQAGQGATHFAKMDSMKIITPLTEEMIKKYAPNVWKRTPEKYWDRVKSSDGRILGIPYESQEITKELLPDMSDEEIDYILRTKTASVNDIYGAAGSLFIRDDILKMMVPEAKDYDELVALLDEKQEAIGEYMLDIPIYSTQDYIDFMYKIKELGLKENGKTVYAFGYSGGDLWESLTYLGGEMYGYKTHAYTGTWNFETKSVEIPIVKDIVKQAAKTQNQMLADRVIDPESLAQTLSQFEQKVLGGQYAICAAQMLGDITSVNKQLEDAGKGYRFIPFWTQVPAANGYEAHKEENLFNASLCFTNKLSEEQLIKALQWIDVQYTDEFEEIKFWGPEEAGLYKENEDGTRTFTDERFTKYFIENDKTALTPEETMGLQGPTEQGYQIGGLFGVRPTYIVAASKWSPEIMTKYEKYTASCSSGFKFPHTSEHVQNVKLSPPASPWAAEFTEIPEVVEYWAARGQWEDFFKTTLASDVEDFDKNWQEATDKLNKIVNIDEMTEKMTAAVQHIAEQME